MVDIVSPADAVFRCIRTAGMSLTAVEHEGDVSRGALSIIRRRLIKDGNPGLQMCTRTLIRVAHACGYRIILATEPGKIDADAFELGEETLQ
jgi:hypothetical protein